MTSTDQADERHLKSVKRAFDIVEFLRGSGPMSLSDIAEEFDMPLSTAHIHLSTLVDSGYVIKTDGKYKCSLKFLSTGGELRRQSSVYRFAKSEVDELCAETGENCNIGTEQDGYLIQLYTANSPESIDDDAPPGKYLHLHTTAMGKAILSELNKERREVILEKRGLPAVTENAITSKGELLEELDEIRDQGYAVNKGEHYEGVFAIAVPILSKGGAVLGAISISGPLSRFDTQQVEDELVPALIEKKNIIELKIMQRS